MADEIPMFVDAPEADTSTPTAAPPVRMSDEAAMADAMVQRGIWTREQADAELLKQDDDQGFNPTPAPAAKPVLPDGVDEFTFAAFQGAKSPAEYRFEQPLPGTDLKTDMAQEIEIRGIFHAAEVPPAIGTEVAKLWNRAAASPPTEAQLEVSRQQCEQTLAKAWGADFSKNLGIAMAEVQRISAGNPKLIGMLEQSGIGNSAWLCQTLLHMAKARGRAK
jgi:hypothetical protein